MFRRLLANRPVRSRTLFSGGSAEVLETRQLLAAAMPEAFRVGKGEVFSSRLSEDRITFVNNEGQTLLNGVIENGTVTFDGQNLRVTGYDQQARSIALLIQGIGGAGPLSAIDPDFADARHPSYGIKPQIKMNLPNVPLRRGGESIIVRRLDLDGTVVRRADLDIHTHTGTLTVRYASGGVLANDDYSESHNPFARPIRRTEHGELKFRRDGSFEYTPDAGFTGRDSFTYYVTGDEGATNPATVTLDVVPAEPRLTAEGGSIELVEDRPTRFSTMRVKSSAPTRDAYRRVTKEPEHGRVVFHPSGEVTFIPNENFNGTDSFEFVVGNGTSESAPGRVDVTVASRIDAPILMATANNRQTEVTYGPGIRRQVFVDEHSPAGTVVATLDVVAREPGAVELSLAQTSGARFLALDPTTGEVSLTEKAALLRPGNRKFNFRVDMMQNDVRTARWIQLQYVDVNDPPVAEDLHLTVNQGQRIEGRLEASDPEGNELSYAVVGTDSPLNDGFFSIDGSTGEYVLEAYPRKAVGASSFEVSVSDGTDESIVTVNLTTVDVEFAPSFQTIFESGIRQLTPRESGEWVTQVEVVDQDGDPDVAFRFAGADGLISPDGLLELQVDQWEDGEYDLRVHIADPAAWDGTTQLRDYEIIADDGKSPPVPHTMTLLLTTEQTHPREIYGSVSNLTPAGFTVVNRGDEFSPGLSAVLMSGADSGMFVLDVAAGDIRLREDAPQWSESADEHSRQYQVVVTDQKPDGSEVVTIVTVEHDNDYFNNAPQVPFGASLTITEGATLTFTLDDLGLVDPEGDAFTLSFLPYEEDGYYASELPITANEDGSFTASLPDDDANATLIALAEIDSDGADFSTVEVRFDVRPTSDPPIFSEFQNTSLTLPAGDPVGTPIGAIVVYDPDFQRLTHQLTAGNADGLLAIDTKSGELSLTRVVSGGVTRQVTVQATDPDGNRASRVFNLTLDPDAVVTTPVEPVGLWVENTAARISEHEDGDTWQVAFELPKSFPLSDVLWSTARFGVNGTEDSIRREDGQIVIEEVTSLETPFNRSFVFTADIPWHDFDTEYPHLTIETVDGYLITAYPHYGG